MSTPLGDSTRTHKTHKKNEANAHARRDTEAVTRRDAREDGTNQFSMDKHTQGKGR